MRVRLKGAGSPPPLSLCDNLDSFDEVLSAEQSEPDAAQQLGNVLTATVWIVVDPADDGLEHYLLVLDVQVVAADDLDHRLVRQHQQLVALRRDVREMFHDEPASSQPRALPSLLRHRSVPSLLFNPLEFRGNYSAMSNSMELVHWPLMSGLLYLVQQGGDWAGPQPAQAPPPCTKCNIPLINGQCTNHCIAV